MNHDAKHPVAAAGPLGHAAAADLPSLDQTYGVVQGPLRLMLQHMDLLQHHMPTDSVLQSMFCLTGQCMQAPHGICPCILVPNAPERHKSTSCSHSRALVCNAVSASRLCYI